MNGKGSHRRPEDAEQVRNNWDRVFAKPSPRCHWCHIGLDGYPVIAGRYCSNYCADEHLGERYDHGPEDEYDDDNA
jgi:hypothetical protein